MAEMASLLKRGVAEIIVEAELRRLLESDRPLRLKQGFDPSRPDIHLGHVVGLRKLRQFQEQGHKVILIVGDWTAQIGDPSGESVTRPMLTYDEVQANAQTYLQQFFKVVDKEKTEVRWQSEWFGKFSLGEVIKLTSKFTVAQFLARDDFSKRYAAGRPIAITELLYPLLQAYDSVVIKSDVEFGGVDQKFNCLVGRELQTMLGQPAQQVFLMPLLVGTDGKQKMSKSLNNYIGIDEPAGEMYGKVMSIPDSLLHDYFELLTDISDEELAELRKQLATQSVNPMLLKKRLAREIVGQFHSAKAAEESEAEFEKVYQKREMPEEIPYVYFSEVAGSSRPNPVRVFLRPRRPGVLLHPVEFHFVSKELGVDKEVEGYHSYGNPASYGADTVETIYALGLVKSKSEARRLLQSGAIEVDGEKALDYFEFHDGTSIRVGKHRFVRLVKSDKGAEEGLRPS